VSVKLVLLLDKWGSITLNNTAVLGTLEILLLSHADLFALSHVEMEDSVLLQMCVHVPLVGLEHNVNEVFSRLSGEAMAAHNG